MPPVDEVNVGKLQLKKVSEVFCPRRLTEVAAEHGLEEGFALDLVYCDPVDGEPWDFDIEANQTKALRRIETEDPGIVLVSPECSPFCSLQAWNFPRMTEASVHERADRGMRHLAFAVLVCLLPYHRGRYFILEHPDGATSWRTDVLKALLGLPRVQRVAFDFAWRACGSTAGV